MTAKIRAPKICFGVVIVLLVTLPGLWACAGPSSSVHKEVAVAPAPPTSVNATAPVFPGVSDVWLWYALYFGMLNSSSSSDAQSYADVNWDNLNVAAGAVQGKSTPPGQEASEAAAEFASGRPEDVIIDAAQAEEDGVVIDQAATDAEFNDAEEGGDGIEGDFGGGDFVDDGGE